MISPARRAAHHVLRRVELDGAFSDDALCSTALSNLDQRDRNLATEIVYGTLRWQLAIDDILEQFSSREWESVDPIVRIILRMSLYQLWRMDRIPDHALINDAVEIAKSELDRGKAGFVNGLLRTLGRQRPWKSAGFDERRPQWIRASLPKWLWDRWAGRYGDDLTFRFAVSLNQPPQIAIWGAGSECAADGEMVPGMPSSIVPGGRLIDKTIQDERYWIQDEASQLVPHLFGPVSGSRIWDACAAPGGKSAILSTACGEFGSVFSSDLRWNRILRMKAALQVLADRKPAVLAADAETGCPFRDGAFDGVLADVPCSGLGTLRRNPEIKWRFSPGRLSALQGRQLSILHTVANSVRIGGCLLYSTCSTEPEENEHVVRMFLDMRQDFRQIRPSSPPGVEHWLDEQGSLRTFPTERRWDGLFGALMLRFS